MWSSCRHGRLSHLWSQALEDEWAAHYSEFYTVEEQKRLARAQGEKLKGPDRLPSMTNFLIYIHLQRKNPPYSAQTSPRLGFLRQQRGGWRSLTSLKRRRRRRRSWQRGRRTKEWMETVEGSVICWNALHWIMFTTQTPTRTLIHSHENRRWLCRRGTRRLSWQAIAGQSCEVDTRVWRSGPKW
jgi:hypothetical protein